MKKVLFTVWVLVMCTASAWATHYRAGELTYEVLSYLRYKVTVTTYTTDINTPPDSDTITIHWGDGTTSTAFRSPSGGTPLGNNIKKNVYTDTHTYLGPLPYYVIWVEDPNRISGIRNINGGNSINVQFYIEDTLRIYNPSFVGVNNSPILLNPPIDYANLYQVFIHNPAAYDPDGDSLSFELVTPLSENGGVPVPNYQLPDQISPGINNNITIDERTGEIVWDAPQETGIYNIAILVREYREGLLMGTVLRDMQIIVDNQPNRPPEIDAIHDTCIIAGSVLSISVFASDPDNGQRVYLTATGGPFEVSNSPAVFTPNSNVGFATADFDWVTNCSHIRDQFYQVVIKAEDDYRNSTGLVPLTDLETWIIRVMAPPPQDLVADAVGNKVTLTWDDPYACDSAQTDRFIGFSVWRKEGCDNLPIDTCTPGLLGMGYTKLADGIFDYTYVDSTVVRGKQYSYRVLSEFADQAPLGFYYNNVYSLPSNEACSELKKDLPLIDHVTVEQTDASNGEILITWLNPVADSVNLDTTQFPGPYEYRLYGDAGFVSPGNTTPLVTYQSPSFQGLTSDTSYNHTGINTVGGPYTYRVDFYSNGTLVGSSETASSVFLTVGIDDNQLNLSWESYTPWTNFLYNIYRLNNNTSLYEFFDTTSQTAYTDVNVVNDSNYCYYIQSVGWYTASGLSSDTLLNLSQRDCGTPVDTIAPCPPVLTASNDCDQLNDGTSCEIIAESLYNTVAFTIDSSCGYDVRRVNIYYAKPGETEFVLIDSVLTNTDSVYLHRLTNSLAGCYVVTALDEKGNESEVSNSSCVGNCPCYILPNVFTPNGDGDNDFFIPIVPYRFVSKVDMKIFNRWGVLVYESSDPDLGWDGNDSKTGKPMGEDVYYYVCKVIEEGVDGLQQSDPIVLKGYIHLIRGNGGSN